jgi:chemotaxis protein CheD
MNHFMLPHPLREDLEPPARYGINAMELLINRIMNLGGFRRRLQAKLFGGANVLHTHHATPSVAERNAAFAREFLDRENIPLVSWRLGGYEAMEVVFFPDTARTLVKSVRKLTAAELAAREAQYASELDKRAVQPPDDDVTLF